MSLRPSRGLRCFVSRGGSDARSVLLILLVVDLMHFLNSGNNIKWYFLTVVITLSGIF